MVEAAKIILMVLAILCITSNVYSDPCTNKCLAPCTPVKCHTFSSAFGGCWFDGVNCISCKEKSVKSCEQYGKDSCDANPCIISGGCKWVRDTCMALSMAMKNCKTDGCPKSYRCMADGDCIHNAVSTQEYCNTAYKEHDLYFDVGNVSSCNHIGDICNAVQENCESIPNRSALDKSRINECMLLKKMCLQCQGDCELRKSAGDIENIIYSVAAGIAILAIIVNGIQIATAEDALTRNNAKKSVTYTIISLIIIIAAVKFIEQIWSSFL